MSGLDFDGDYGRQYRQRIRLSIPAYDAVLEIGAAALAAKTPAARHVWWWGPGAGEELPGLLQAMPLARFTLLEPSEQMADFCRQRIAALHAGSRCLLHQQSLADSGWSQRVLMRWCVTTCCTCCHQSSSSRNWIACWASSLLEAVCC